MTVIEWKKQLVQDQGDNLGVNRRWVITDGFMTFIARTENEAEWLCSTLNERERRLAG